MVIVTVGGAKGVLVEAGLDFCNYRHWACLHVIREVLVEIIGVVVVKVDPFHGIIF